MPIRLSTTRRKSAPSNLMVLLHTSLCTYHSAIGAPGNLMAAGQPTSRQGGLQEAGTHGGQQTLKNMTGSLFKSKIHLHNTNWTRIITVTLINGYFTTSLLSPLKKWSQIYVEHDILPLYYYHHIKNGHKSMSNMSLYNDDHDDDIGPAPAGPAESAHNMTL